MDVPYGTCRCGCGRKTTIAPYDCGKYKKGEPFDFVLNHRLPKTKEQRIKLFWSHIDVRSKEECWLWKLSRSGKVSKSYGMFKIDGKHKQKAHRIAYILTFGPLPRDIYVLHNCPGGDIEACCNPYHMFTGTDLDNIHDMHKKGRAHIPEQLYGEEHPKSVYTDEQVLKMRELRRQGYTIQKIADMVGAEKTSVWKIVTYQYWQHLP